MNINWEVEIVALQDLSVTVPRSHVLAVRAFWNEFAAAADSGDPLDQKILTAKIAAETISALEDLGALGWSISRRGSGGILRNYLNCQPRNTRSFYEAVSSSSTQIATLMLLPDETVLDNALTEVDRETFEQALQGLNQALSRAADTYFKRVDTYNNLKHGFPLIIRLDKLANSTPTTDWEEHVNIVTGLTRDGRIHYVDLERSEKMLLSLKNAVEATGRAWKELADVILFLWERGVSLDPSES